DLAEIQKNSFEWFLREGLSEELKSFSPIKDYTGRLELYFLHDDYVFEDHTEEKKSKTPAEARRNDQSYTKKFYANIRLVDRESGEIKESRMFIGEIPMMTEKGTFIVNGAERVVVSQITRSPGVYFKKESNINGKRSFNATLIPYRGAWLRIEGDNNDIIVVKIDKNRKIPITTFLMALGYSRDELLKLFHHGEFLEKTLERDPVMTREQALVEIYKKLRPGDPPSVQGGFQTLHSRFFDEKRYNLGKVGRYKINNKLGLNIPDSVSVLTREDIVAVTDYLIDLYHEIGSIDDIDHLGNRRIRSVGELLRDQFRVGLNRLERIIRERMTLADAETLTPSSLLNPKPLVAAIKEFFGSSQLSQFMDQTNPLAELTHKRRISALGPGGLTRERAGFAVRDIHPSHHGRICPVETPEGPNAGLIGSLATYARVNNFGFLETPYRKVTNGKASQEVVYLSANEEDLFRIAPGDVSILEDGTLKGEMIPIRYKGSFIVGSPAQIDFISVSPVQIVSLGTSLIPFLEHDDANRALMGANMQRQAVPLLRAESPIIGTGLERQVARDSGMCCIARDAGEIVSVDGSQVTIQYDGEPNPTTYQLSKFLRSNQDTCVNQRPIVNVGDKIEPGQVLADGPASEQGDLALGKNLLITFMPWEGYNFEDAILISEKLVQDDVYTTIHIEKNEIDARTTKLGPEEITREIPNVSEEAIRHLDEDGVVRVGSLVKAGDILVGKITPKGETDQPPEEKLLRAIFGEKARDVKDNSLRVPHGEGGRVVGVHVLDRLKGDELPPVANKLVRIHIAQKRKIRVGDKMAGRHGNKGIVSRILPVEDMPHLPDGTPLDIVLNPLGVPSRMNVGQVYETVLGLAGWLLNEKYEVWPFDEMYEEEASRKLVANQIKKSKEKTKFDWITDDGKIRLIDGRTGEYFDSPSTVGRMYMMKLVHLVDDKMHARSTGPYSLVTQQPLGGKAQFGGQRLGEMECWALEAYGASYNLQEMLTVKSDNVIGRSKVYEAIVKGNTLPPPGIPESFKVLVCELQALGLNMRIMGTNHQGDLEEFDVQSDDLTSTPIEKAPVLEQQVQPTEPAPKEELKGNLVGESPE
ncbi:MAG TPA: DNA-directed RNA polymerase subunit beta, partial [Vampirovibrionales bacterium]